MSRIVRLEGLSVAVNPRDLRLYFAGLDIPQGGVTIIGGERGVAYLDFTTLADARSALRLSGRLIKDSIVYVYPSSITEMVRSLKNYEPSVSSRNGFNEDRNLQRRDSSAHRTHLYLRITAGSIVSNKTAVRRYFDGLHIIDIMNTSNNRAIRRGDALIKFGNSNDAYEAKSRYRDSKEMTVIWSSEREWLKYSTVRNEGRGHPSRSPHKRSRSPRRRTRSPEVQSNEHDSVHDEDFCVHLANLSSDTRKEDLKKLFFNLVSKDHISFLYDEKGHRTKECFVVFKNRADYKRALKLDQVTCNGSVLFISPISKSRMRNLLTGRKALFSHYHKKGKCLYLRNFPKDVTKRDIQKFFTGFSLNEEDISLLCDRGGVGLGEVLVTFSSEEDLKRAEKLHRKKFRKREIPLRRIPKEKLQGFLCANFVSLMPDPYDCVTQEDDLQDEDSDQGMETVDEDDQDDSMADEDLGFHQTDNTNECVTQEDDAPDNSAVHVDDEDDPDNSFILVDDAPDNSIVHVDDEPDDAVVRADDTVHAGDVPDDAVDRVDDAVHVGDAPDDAVARATDAVHVGDAPDDAVVHAGDAVVHAGDAPDDAVVHADEVPSTLCVSNEKSVHVDNGNALAVGATSSYDGLEQ